MLKFEDVKIGDELVYDDVWDYVVVEIIDSVLIVRRKTSDGWQGNSFDQRYQFISPQAPKHRKVVKRLP